MIKGMTIKLINLVQDGFDNFDKPIYVEKQTDVSNVLIAPSTSTEIVDTLNLTGKKVVYTLAIPKGDTNVWADQVVEFFDQRFHVINEPAQGIDELIPLAWNKKVMVEKIV